MRLLQAFRPSRLPFARQAMAAVILTASAFMAPTPALPAETPATAAGKPSGTEIMIEEMIRQMDTPEAAASAPAAPAEEPAASVFLACIPNVRPVGGSITSGFGYRKHPIYNRRMFHTGIDFSAAEGSPVAATGNGTVAFSGYEKGYGQKVIINHGFGYSTTYAHLSKSLVRQGQKIRRGEVIALSGNTGISTGPHLHYEVHKDGVRVDPAAYFFDADNPDRFITIQQPSAEAIDSNS
ncbi:M23 family metallopeptidase [Chlorobium sp. N1]|uniref:M23 family metallopeptidase n=1 Tax=Chlorobium sp. N1 TaxID=2491138 RepID=UPI001F602E27|nr:M23 family metallopeptidase [Chlorobium sp. N1]